MMPSWYIEWNTGSILARVKVQPVRSDVTILNRHWQSHALNIKIVQPDGKFRYLLFIICKNSLMSGLQIKGFIQISVEFH